jgi:c-di-GMP-binding flagellar brake protein YcgR
MATARKVNFRFGDVVQLEESSGHKASYRVQLVGVLPGLSLLVTAPDVRGAHVPLADGQIFEVRIFNGDDALAFSSMVIRSCQEPYPYVHLSYPERIEHVLVRNARRTRLKLPAQVNPLRTTRSDDPLSLASSGI